MRGSIDGRKGGLVASLVTLLFLAVILRLELLTTRSLWIDEALSLDIASTGPEGIVRIARSAEPHPPGYYLLLWGALRLFGDSIATARAVSFVFGSAAPVLTWMVGRRVGGDWVGVGAAAVVALHPFQIFASNEIRMYPLLTTLGLVATLLLLEAVRRDRLTLWVLYGVAAAAVGYTSYYGFLLLGGHGLAVIGVLARRIGWRGPAAAGLTGLVCYGPWLPSLIPSITSNPVPWRPPPSLDYVIGMMSTQTVGGYLLGGPSYHASGAWNAGWAGLAGIFLLLLVLGAREIVRRSPEGGLLVWPWAAAMVAVLAASALLNKVAAYFYHLTYLQPYAAVLVVTGVVGLAQRAGLRGERCAPLAIALVVAIVGAAAAEAQTGSREVYRFDLAARWLARQYRQGDVTVYFTRTGQHVLRRYLSPAGPEVAIAPSPFRWTLEDTRPLLERAVAPLGPQHRRVWLVLTPPFPPGSVPELVRLLEARGFQADKGVSFRGVFVHLFERQGASR